MTESYEHIRNRHCHEVLSALYKNSDGVARESTYGEMLDGKPGRLFSNRFFFNLAISELINTLNISDIMLQEVCEFLELNNHIEAATKTDKGIFEKIRFTAAGVTAYKTNYYLKENKKITDDYWLNRSAKINNIATPIIAGLTFFVALVSLINDCNGKSECKSQDPTQTDKQAKEQTTSVKQTEQTNHYGLTNTNDTILQYQKKDSLTSIKRQDKP